MGFLPIRCLDRPNLKDTITVKIKRVRAHFASVPRKPFVFQFFGHVSARRCGDPDYFRVSNPRLTGPAGGQ